MSVAAGVRRMHKAAAYIRGREAYILALLLFIVASGAGLLLHARDAYSFYYFGDASSHVIKAREFTDGVLQQRFYIGTTWLPLPHLLLLPFASVDSFFFSGIAGAFVGIPSLVGTGVLLFLIIKDVTGSSWSAFLMAALFGINPNIVYMALTPMDELSLIFLVTLAGFALFRWLKRGSLGMLFLSAAAIMSATLCRYEAWLLAPLLLLAALPEAAALWRSSRTAEAIRIVAIACVSFVGIGAWVAWHFIAFRDPLLFAQGTYSALADYYRQSDQRLPLNILITFGRAILDIFGPVLIVVAAASYISIRKNPDRRHTLILLMFFITPLLFTLTATLAGYVGIDRWWWNWRYVLTSGLFLAVAGGIGIAGLPPKFFGLSTRPFAAAALLAMPLIQISIPSVNVATYMDAAKCMSPTIRNAIVFGGRLSSSYREGSIALLTEESCADRVKIASWLPQRIFHSIHFPLGYHVPDSLLSSDNYLVVEKNKARDAWTLPPNSPAVPDYFPPQFQVVMDDSCFSFLERSPGSDRTGNN
jgi:hypothetical protein